MDPLQYAVECHCKVFGETTMVKGLYCESPIAAAADKPLPAEGQDCSEAATTRPRL